MALKKNILIIFLTEGDKAIMNRKFTKYPKTSVTASQGIPYSFIREFLSDNAVYDTLKPFEKKILAKAANSIEYQVYLMGAIEALDLAGVSTSETFDRVAEILIENWDFDRQRKIAEI